MQGLLVTPSNNWPKSINNLYVEKHKKLEQKCNELNCKLIDFALEFIKSQTYAEAVIVGLCSKSQLLNLIDSWSKDIFKEKINWEKWNISDQSFVDPRFW